MADGESLPGGGRSQRITVTDGESLGDLYDPYFNRTWRHYCSHRHTPNRPEASGYACGVRKGGIVYLAHPVFAQYAQGGMVAVREYAAKALRLLLEEPSVEAAGLPSAGRVFLRNQPDKGRRVLHLLYAPTAKRGGVGDVKDTEVIEDIPPLRDIEVRVRTTAPVAAVRLVPQGEDLPFVEESGGFVRFTVPEVLCHQMVEIK